jgi:two-component sensor histidine kinase
MNYGALSSAGGRVVIRWDIYEGRLPRKFWLSWEERGGPRVSPPTWEGFGHKLLSRIGSDSPGAASGLSFRPEGLNWRFECEEQIVLRH